MSEEQMELTTRERVIHEFIQNVYKHNLHPADAAKKMGMHLGLFEALRASHPELEAAWYLSDKRVKGKVKRPKNMLELKQRFSGQFMAVFMPRVMSMLVNIEDGPEGDLVVRDILKNKIIGELLPKETVSHVEIEQTVDIRAQLRDTDYKKLVSMAGDNAHQIGQLQKEIADRARTQEGFADATDAEFEHKQE